MEEFWGEPISVYTRAEALADGVLVDVSETAREAGFVWPVAVTAALMSDVRDVPEGAGQDEEGRLWDVLYMARHAIREDSAVRRQERHLRPGRVPRRDDDPSALVYALFMGVGAGAAVATNYRAKLVCGPGDAGEPVVTISRPEED